VVAVTVTANVTNQGAGTATNVLVQFTRDGQAGGETTIPSIAPGEIRQATATWDVPIDQPVLVSVYVDPYDNFIECNDGNNNRQRTIIAFSHRVLLPLISANW
jgi:subtilase family serine protease